MIQAAVMTVRTAEETPDRCSYCWYFDGCSGADYNLPQLKGEEGRMRFSTGWTRQFFRARDRSASNQFSEHQPKGEPIAPAAYCALQDSSVCYWRWSDQ